MGAKYLGYVIKKANSYRYRQVRGNNNCRHPFSRYCRSTRVLSKDTMVKQALGTLYQSSLYFHYKLYLSSWVIALYGIFLNPYLRSYLWFFYSTLNTVYNAEHAELIQLLIPKRVACIYCAKLNACACSIDDILYSLQSGLSSMSIGWSVVVTHTSVCMVLTSYPLIYIITCLTHKKVYPIISYHQELITPRNSHVLLGWLATIVRILELLSY